MHKYHIILLIISFLLIFIFYNYDYDNPKKLFILKIIYFLVVGYLSILFGLSNPGTRYFLPIVPFYLIFSSIGLYYFLKYKIYKNKSFFYTLVVITVSMILIANINLLNLIFNNITLIRLFQIIFYFIIVFIVIRIQVSFFKEKEVTNLITNFVVLLFIFMVGFVFVVDSKYDNHYKLKKNVNIKQIIELNDFKKSNFDKAFLCIDISSQYTNSQLKVLFNNEYSTNIKLQKAGTFFDTNFPLVYNDTLYKPHWIFFEIPLNIIKKTNIVNTVCNNANIYYSYNEKNRRLPSLFYYKHGINDIIFGPFSDVDKRCYSITIVNSLKRETFINDVKKKYDAHIFLLLKENGDYYLPKKYKKFNDVNIKYIALVNPIDRKLVFWSKTNPGKEFMKIYGNLYLYVAGEIDRFYSGYHFY